MANVKAYRLVFELQQQHDVLLTGGLCIEAWSIRAHTTRDWDIVGGPEVDFDAVIRSLRTLGYVKTGNVWVRQEQNLPPQHPGQFPTTQYFWGKTHKTIIETSTQRYPVSTVAPEWLFVDRVHKAIAGQVTHAEQALFLLQKFSSEGSSYDWNEALVKRISKNRDVPEEALHRKRLDSIAGRS